MIALTHTVECDLDLSAYLLNVNEFDYVILSRFQTDSWEFRFGSYRRLAGTNFHVSVNEILQEETKIDEHFKSLSNFQSFGRSNVSKY